MVISKNVLLKRFAVASIIIPVMVIGMSSRFITKLGLAVILAAAGLEHGRIRRNIVSLEFMSNRLNLFVHILRLFSFGLAFLLFEISFETSKINSLFFGIMMSTQLLGLVTIAEQYLYNEAKEKNSHDKPTSVMFSLGLDLYFLFFYVVATAFVLPLRELRPDGYLYVVFTCALSWITDTAALLAGSYFGKRSVFPAISPKKTWAGILSACLSGVPSAIILRFVFSYFADKSMPELVTFRQCLLFGMVVPILGIQGDLLESAYKRTAKIKDTSVLFGPHGGVVDRLDSLSPLFPFAYYVFA